MWTDKQLPSLMALMREFDGLLFRGIFHRDLVQGFEKGYRRIFSDFCEAIKSHQTQKPLFFV